ncbi:MAG: hypothetical protein LC785_12590 [Acidobacteria bacterium]|nr:hypothetical protein [Acidobacteriota bacterium]MCA1642756.1 hypothetical protein [Acidobacteriota bacterium]
MRRRLYRVSCIVVACVVIVAASVAATTPSSAQRASKRGKRPQYGRVCPDPVAPCPSEMTFEPNDLRFRLPKNAVIYDSEEFYAVVLKTLRAPSDEDCEQFVPEGERTQAQKLFPRRKVFTSRCQQPVSIYYTNLAPRARVMAVYGGATRAEAERTLAEVRATGKFPGAFLRRMRIGVNGT